MKTWILDKLITLIIFRRIISIRIIADWNSFLGSTFTYYYKKRMQALAFLEKEIMEYLEDALEWEKSRKVLERQPTRIN